MTTVSPVFLLGTQRSGTTLLTRILSSHSTFYMQNELPMEGVFSSPLDKKTIVKRITAKIKRLHSETLSVEGEAETWGLKDPLLTNHLPILASHFPDSKYILIVRDGRGVVNSYIENKWGLGTNVYTGAKRWAKEVELQTAFVRRFSKNSLVIRYEDLIANLSNLLPKICNFLEITYEPHMLNYYKADADFRLNKENRHTNQAPNINLAEKWKKKLTSRQISIINSIAYTQLNEYNYELNEKCIDISIAEQYYYAVHQKIIGELQLQYQLKLKHLLTKYNLIRNRK